MADGSTPTPRGRAQTGRVGTEELGVGFGPELAAAAAALPLLNATHSDLADSEILSLLTRTNRATIGTDAYLELCKTGLLHRWVTS